MEMRHLEVTAVEEVLGQVAPEVRALNDLELALVGGGIADPVFA